MLSPSWLQRLVRGVLVKYHVESQWKTEGKKRELSQRLEVSFSTDRNARADDQPQRDQSSVKACDNSDWWRRLTHSAAPWLALLLLIDLVGAVKFSSSLRQERCGLSENCQSDYNRSFNLVHRNRIVFCCPKFSAHVSSHSSCQINGESRPCLRPGTSKSFRPSHAGCQVALLLSQCLDRCMPPTCYTSKGPSYRLDEACLPSAR